MGEDSQDSCEANRLVAMDAGLVPVRPAYGNLPRFLAIEIVRMPAGLVTNLTVTIGLVESLAIAIRTGFCEFVSDADTDRFDQLLAA